MVHLHWELGKEEVTLTLLDDQLGRGGAGRHARGQVLLDRRVVAHLLDALGGQALADEDHHHLHHLAHQ